MDCNTVNERILELCRQRGWSEYKLAKMSSISNSTINAMFKNNHLPTFYTLQKICNAFQISLSQFFDCELFEPNEESEVYKRLWKNLSPQDREKVLIYMYGLLHLDIKKEDIMNDI